MTVTEDEVRVAEIAQYAVVGRPPRRDLQALVELAAEICHVPTAVINLITASEQVQVAAVGFEASVCAREDSMCSAVLHEPAPVVVADARLDARFHENPFVTGAIADVRFYAATQLVTPDDVVIGTLCVFDRRPRELDARQHRSLRTLADRVVDLLELGRRSRALERSLQELTTARDELRRSNEQLAGFAAQAAHDLRNPLTSVTMSLQLLSTRPVVTQDRDAGYMVDKALSGAGRMEQLIDELLSYGQVGGRLRKVPVDLGALAGEVVTDLAGSLDGTDLEVGPLPTVDGDPTQLRAVLQNLLANAVKFSRTVTSRPRVEVTSRRTGGAWRVEVADNGPGVPADQRERVLLPLTRVDESVEGVGLGLAIAARVVREHGGRIGVDEAPGGGALVWFELPRREGG